MKRVVIRCDGGTGIGMGHVVRCIALAEMLREEFSILFLLQETNPSIYKTITDSGFQYQTLPATEDYTKDSVTTLAFIKEDDIVVLDGYHFQTAYQRAIKSNGNKLVAIDDLHAWHHVADVVINHADGVRNDEYNLSNETTLLIGSNYSLLRPIFHKNIKSKGTWTTPSKAMVSMGASDENNLTIKFAQVLLQIPSITEIKLLLSSVNPNIKKLQEFSASHAERIKPFYNLTAIELINQLDECDFILCPASSISLESCARNRTVITGFTAPNQISNLKALDTRGAVYNLGNLNEITSQNALLKISYLCSNRELINAQLVKQREIFDGKNVLRLLEKFKQL